MSNYIVEVGQPIVAIPQQEQVYTIKYTKVVKDLEGNDVTVIDDQRTERVTVDQIKSQIASYQNAIKVCEGKLEAIAKL